MPFFYILILIIAFILVIYTVYSRIKTPGVKKSLLQNFEVIEVQLNKNVDVKDAQYSALAAENMFNALHGLLKENPELQEYVSFEIVSSGSSGIRFYVTCPSTVLKFVESQIYAQYPDCQIKVSSDYTRGLNPNHTNYIVSSVYLSKPDYFAIKSFRDFEIDPLSSVTSAISSLHPSDLVWFQIITRPIADIWQKEGYNYVSATREGKSVDKNDTFISPIIKLIKTEMIEILAGIATGLFTYKDRAEELKKAGKPNAPVKLSMSKEAELQSIENKLGRLGYEVCIRLVSSSEDPSRMESNLRSVVASLKQFSSGTLNSFVYNIAPNKEVVLEDYVNRKFDEENAFILDSEELSTIFHFPSANIDTPNLAWIYSKESEPPTNLPSSDCVYIGETMYRNKKIKFGIKNGDDRLRHLYVIGKSGVGKSTLFESMITQDIANGFGVGVLDPHGETIDKVLERIPDNRIDDVVYFDPSDTEYPIGLNMMQIDDQSQKNLLASGLVSAIHQHFDYSWGPRLEYLLNYAILTLLEVPGTTMLGITRLLEDQNYQNYILHQVKDPVVLKFWEQEFKQMKGNQKLVTEAIAPIQNKVNRFLASTTIRNILGHQKSTLDIWEAMNSGKILLMNLTKGKIGSDNANLLGALLVSRIQFYALQRAKIPYNDRKPFYLYVDEFQNFASGSFEEILSESRKYKLGLYLTHQFTAQLPENVLKAVYGNVGTLLSFSVGAPDARELEREFAPYFNAEDLISLERFQIYIKLMLDGMQTHPFSGRILIPWEDDFLIQKTDNRNIVLQKSREKYGVPREYVETKINKWVETKFDKGMAIAQEYKDNKKVN